MADLTDVTPFDVCEHFLAGALAALDDCNSDPITRSYVDIGPIPIWDDCCGQLTVGIEFGFQSGLFPTERADERRCDDDMIVFTVRAALTRCMPTEHAPGSNAPSAQALHDAARKIYGDAGTLWRAMTDVGALPDEWSLAQPRMTPVVPTGGCASIEMRVTVGIPEAMFCGDC